MTKFLEKFENQSLSRSEMKNVAGGANYVCSCTNHVGTWSNNYKNQASANASIEGNCRGGGTCNIA
jgi:natural product precursor